MKRMLMKRIFLLLIGCLWYAVVNAQEQRLFDEYLQETGDQAEIFIGKMEPGYTSTVYVNHPYWQSEEFFIGEVKYKGLLYRNVLLRYDAFLKQLVVKTPVKQSNVYVPIHWVEEFAIGGTVFDIHEGEFMALLYKGSRVELLERMRVSMKENMNHARVQYEFKRKESYFVLCEDRMCEVNSMRSVLKLYPELEKELKRFAKMNKLNFREHRKASLVAMVKYADELLGNH